MECHYRICSSLLQWILNEWCKSTSCHYSIRMRGTQTLPHWYHCCRYLNTTAWLSKRPNHLVISACICLLNPWQSDPEWSIKYRSRSHQKIHQSESRHGSMMVGPRSSNNGIQDINNLL